MKFRNTLVAKISIKVAEFEDIEDEQKAPREIKKETKR